MEYALLHRHQLFGANCHFQRQKLRTCPLRHRPRIAASAAGRDTTESGRTVQVNRLLKTSAAAALVAGVALSWWRNAQSTHAGEAGGGSGSGSGSGSGGGGGGDGASPSGGSSGGPVSPEAAAAAEKARRRRQPTVVLTLVSFAVTRRAYQRITETFAHEYEEATGQRIKFRLSFGGSGTQARAVCDGLPSDVVALALPLDIMKIVESGLIAPGWQDRAPNRSVVAESVVALVTRKGNPKRIRDWDDLTRPDVDVITANPKTAGVARWNFLALWGHLMNQGEEAARDYVYKVFDRVLVQPRDAREASDVFYKQGMGDVLLNYENEVVLTNETYGEDALPYVVPQHNVRVEMPVAVVDVNLRRAKPEAREAADAFVQYLFTPEAQKEFADCGFRAVDKGVRKGQQLPKVKAVWSVEDKLGGWDAAQNKFFREGAILDDIQSKIGEARLAERKAGIRR